jgi:hypothetical protein
MVTSFQHAPISIAPAHARRQVTRVYDRVEAKPSPSPPGSVIARYSRLDAPPPLAPSPAIEYVFSPPPPPHKDVMFTCEFAPGVEVSVDTDVGYTDMQVRECAASRSVRSRAVIAR